MVRIKERYLLVNIVYPPESSKTVKLNLPNLVVHHQPTIEKLTPGLLLKGIRAEVAALFGDYGSGALGNNLSGEMSHGVLNILIISDTHDSEIFITGNIHLHSSMFKSPLPDVVVCIDDDGLRPSQRW